MENWFAEAVEVPAIEAEVCFLVRPNFYFGPDRPSDPADLKRLVEPLLPPDIPRLLPEMVRTAEALGHEAQLSTYYKQIVQLARKYDRPFNSVRSYFWLRFWMWNAAKEVHISFPWYDSFSEIDGFISGLAGADSGLAFQDRDQGWEMEVHAENGNFYFRERDPDSDETHLAIFMSRDRLLAQLAPLRDRAITVIHRLSEDLGADVWTRYVRNEPAFRMEQT